MAQEFTVSKWYAWEDEDGSPIRDQHGNYRGSVFFEEDYRNADATFKTQPEPGDKKYGDIVEYKTKAGKTRMKFQRADRPMEQTSLTSDKPKWQPRDDAKIAAQWAYGRAYEVVKPKSKEDWLKVRNDGQVLLGFVEGVSSLKAQPIPKTDQENERDEDRDTQVALRETFDEGKPINLDDIPF